MSDLLPLEGLQPDALDDRTRRPLAYLDGHPRYAEDRRRICEAIVAEARTHRGVVDPNRLRARLTDPKSLGLAVSPHLIGATVSALATKGALTHKDWIPTTGSVSGNNNKLARRWRLRIDKL